MAWKSSPERYGSAIVTLHWLTLVALIPLIATGFLAADAGSSAEKAALLRVHIPLAVLVLLLTLVRLAGRLRHPAPPPVAGPRWQTLAARFVHFALYLVLAVLLGSGIALLVKSGAMVAVFGGGRLPDFLAYQPRVAHGAAARVLLLLVAIHALAALFHAAVRRDGIFGRMWFGR